MQPLEHLEEQIKDTILLNGIDINIDEHPNLIKEAAEQGISKPELARKIQQIVTTIDRRPYDKIDRLLEPIILKGSITEKEADAIVKASEQDLQRPKVENYIVQVIRRRDFLPREKNASVHDSFKNRWMTEEAWQRYERDKVAVQWLNETAHSPEEMGEISLRKPENAKHFLRNTHFLVPLITTLTRNAALADKFSNIIEQEQDADKRYLKVIYRLNKTLPFRLHNQPFDTVYALFYATAIDYDLFTSAAERYTLGHIHIWLNETDAINADKLPGGFNYNSFLKFVYKIFPQHPFYLDALRFTTPEQLIQQVASNAGLWNKLAAAISGGQIQVWLAAIGRQDWVDTLNNRLAAIEDNNLYNSDEKALASVQALIEIVDNNLPTPQLASDQQQVQLLSIEGSKTVRHSIHLRLVTTGFTKADIYFENNLEGISLNEHACTFWSQNGATDCTLVITIAALQLIKNKTYATNIHIDTEYQNLMIPLQVKVVFPLKAYLLQTGKYAVGGALLFALIRYVTGIFATQPIWADTMRSTTDNTFLPEHYFAYFIGLVLLLGVLTGAVFLIRKWEKL